jgi:queuine tRNA-ribosyltransferase
MSIHFEIVAQDKVTRARAGLLHTPHGAVETPVFMPVGTGGTVKGMRQEELEALGVQILLANTYHLYLRPGHELIREAGGLHRFMAWPRPILTDSGGFQVMSLKPLGRVTEDGVWFRSHLDGSAHFLSPERAVEIQLALGADIIMALDECVEYPASHETLHRAVSLTTRWAERAKRAFAGDLKSENRDSGFGTRDAGPAANRSPSSESPASKCQSSTRTPESLTADPALFGIVQGGTDLDLRRQSAEALLDLDFQGYALGVGTPEDLAECVARGTDMFDCVLPTRNARNACAFTSEGKVLLKNTRYAQDEGPLDPACSCAVCRRYSRRYLRHLFVSGEMLAAILTTHHNLHFYLDTMRKIRQSLLLGEFAEFHTRVRAGPYRSHS